MSPQTNPKEAPVKKPTATESVDSLIGKKTAEREAKVASGAAEKIAGTQAEVAEVIGGMEKPSEKPSEKKGESGGKGDLKGGGGGDQGQAGAVQFQLKDYRFPPQEVMVKKIRKAIVRQIEKELKNAKRLQSKITAGGAADYNTAIARIRKLKDTLASLFTATVDFLKNLYMKYFTPEGRVR